jgi:hypothetical protein
MRTIIFCALILCGKVSAFEADLSLITREDSLKWNIAGPDQIPNVLSELKWNSLKSIGLGGRLQSNCSWLHFEAQGSYNRIFAGRVRDFDFAEDNRRELFSQSSSKASKGTLFDASALIGLNITCPKSILIVPHVGYSLEEQHLKIFDGVTEVAIDPDDIGPILGLNSSYNAKWYGPFIGLKGYFPLFCGTFGLGFDYYYQNYRGRGHANLRPDILGGIYRHKARGWGQEFFAEFQSRLQETLFFELKVKFGKFWTKKGTETEALRGDEIIIPVRVDFNRVEWNSRSISAHLIKDF